MNLIQKIFKDKDELRRKILLDKAKNNYAETNKYRETFFDPINHLSDDEAKEFMRLEYKMGYSEYNPDED